MDDPGIDVRVADGERERDDAFAVRRAVFVEEQGVDEDVEYDDHDATAVHVVAYDAGDPIGAGRLREVADRVGKIERVAVREPDRGRGVGRALMDALEARAGADGLTTLKLHSQTHAAEFYRTLGYERRGPAFEEAGIPHVEMRKSIE
jgi:predicted GNAT family N-acyltransferase